MKNDLDSWMADLAAMPADRNLGGLEARISGDIARLRQQDSAVSAMAPARFIALSVALVIGAFAGGAMAVSATRAPALGTFAVGTDLAPSTLLAGA
ncbi:MAG: hypothetical protein U1F39_03895 [Steroidobacteraceae bacterium]